MLRLGWQFVFVGVFAMVGGAVRAYNLPFVLAGLIVGMLILHWRWGRHTAAHTGVVRQLPMEAFAGEPFDVHFWVRNTSRWLPAWLLRIDDRICRVEAGGRRDWLGKTQDALEAETEARCGLGLVQPRQNASTGYRCTVSKRGRYDFGPARLLTAAPLGLLAAEASNRQTETFYVFPQRVALQPNWQRVLRSRLGGGTTRGAVAGVDSGDFFGIRGWQQGDSRRHIHWRTTARIGQLAVRQYEQQRRYEVGLVVDAYSERSGSRRGKQEGEDDQLEHLLSVAGSLLIDLLSNPLNRVSLVVVGSKIQTAAVGEGCRSARPEALRMLAELVPATAPDLTSGLEQWGRQTGHRRDLVVLSTRTAEQAFLALPELRQSPWLGNTGPAWFSTADSSLGQLTRHPPPISSATASAATSPTASATVPSR